MAAIGNTIEGWTLKSGPSGSEAPAMPGRAATTKNETSSASTGAAREKHAKSSPGSLYAEKAAVFRGVSTPEQGPPTPVASPTGAGAGDRTGVGTHSTEGRVSRSGPRASDYALGDLMAGTAK